MSDIVQAIAGLRSGARVSWRSVGVRPDSGLVEHGHTCPGVVALGAVDDQVGDAHCLAVGSGQRERRRHPDVIPAGVGRGASMNLEVGQEIAEPVPEQPGVGNPVEAFQRGIGGGVGVGNQ
ncbi:hypothetical protein ACIBU0_35115 [Streptomyces sp. NPDC049627]|uniref:hypothetical protein n=1 Tax=Streptomyces sp. NPDC049627 TaxID=3365595 RepID=UPI0037A96DBB